MALLCATVLFCCLLSRAVGEIYHILPDESTDNCSMCLTLPQLVANSDLFKRNATVTLIFFPGLHNLTDSLHISNMDNVVMRAFNSSAQVTCEISTGFSFTDVQYIEINSLEFSRCGGSRIVNVEEFVLRNVMFDGQGETRTALEIVETTAVLIDSTFKSNENGTLRSNNSLHLDHFWAGGAIIATHSTINISKCRYESNRAEVGGAIYAERECTIAVNDTIFEDNEALGQSPMGGVLYQEMGSVSITNCHFVGNSADNGGVFYSYKASISLKLNQFAGNEATRGGVLSSYNSSVAIDSSLFNGSAATSGGVIQCHNSDLLIDRSQFTDNRARHGAIVHSLRSFLTLTNSQFYLNRATWEGVMYLIEGSQLTITGSQFNSSTATTSGSVIYSNTSNITIENSQFHDNHVTGTDEAPGRGGVMYVLRGDVKIIGSHFHNNMATEGGVFFCITTNIVMNSNQFCANRATNEGGVFFSVISNISEAGSCFVDNAAKYGGVLFDLYRSQVSISGGSEFQNNTVGDQGGIIVSYNGIIFINESSFYRNSAATDGGVVYSVEGKVMIGQSKMKHNSALNGGLVNLYKSEITVKESTLDSNSATSRGGVLFSTGSNVLIEASKLFGNNSTRGGVLYFSVSKVVIINSEVNNSRVDNEREGLGGALFSSNSKVDIMASLFHNNTATGEGGVLYSTKSDVTVNGSHFNDNAAIFNGGVVSSTTGNTTIQDSYFYKSYAFVGGVLYSNNGNVLINGSQFDVNSAFWGGAVDTFGISNIIIEECQFNNNNVTSGGAGLRSNKGNIAMTNNQFFNNTSDRAGGVLHLVACNITLESNHFFYNTALRGSVLFSFTSTVEIHSVVITNNLANNYGTFYLSESAITLSDSNFSSNVGSLLATDTIVNFTSSNSFDSSTPSPISRSNFEEGGALTAFQSMVYLEGETSFQDNRAERGGAIHAIESMLYNTGKTLISSNRAGRSGGGIYLFQSEMFIEPNSSVRIVNNSASKKGGAVHADGSSIKIATAVNETLLEVDKNIAENGGGLSFESNSKIYVLISKPLTYHQVCTVQIMGNVADYGGAIYVNDGSNAATCQSPSTECFFQVLAFHLEPHPDVNTTTLCFSENHARKSTSSATLFGGLLDRCTINPLAEVHNKIPHLSVTNYVYNGSGIAYFAESAVMTPDTISSDPVQVCLCFNDYPNCSYLQPENVEIKKGQPFTVSLVAVDQVGKSVSASIQSSLKFTQSGLGEGQLIQRITENCTNLKFNVSSPESYEELTLFADGPCKSAGLSTRSIRIQFLPCTCPIGFQPLDINGTQCDCQCHKNISDYVERCDSQTETFVRTESSSSVWISYSNVSGYLIYPNCPYDYCKLLSLKTPVLLSHPNGSDAQCAFNRVSLLCGSCEPGLSLSLGSSRCLVCPPYWPALMVVITLAAALAGVALVAVLLYLNLTVAVGSLNGIIFYANIVAANKAIFFSYQAEPSFASIFISFLNFDFGIDTCFFEEMNTYSKTWLQLLFPFYVIILVILLIVISSYSSRFSNLIGKRDPVATLATLILLSYARLLGISFIVFSAGTLRYPDGTRQVIWLPDATISYFADVHVPLLIVAVLITIVVLTFAVIVFLWQWFLRLPKWRVFEWMRNQKLQIFIEKYNIPYTHRHRYWTGNLLFVRVILYLVAAINVSNDAYVALTFITFAIVCILCLKGIIRGPLFKMWPVDLLETFFYFNILFLAVFTWSSRSSDRIVKQEVITNISVTVTFIVLLFIILSHMYLYTSVFSKVSQTKFGERLNQVLKSLSKSKAEQRVYETSEDNLLDMVSRPDKELEVSVQQGMTHSVVEFPPAQETTSTEEVSSYAEGIFSCGTEKESEGDMEGHSVDKNQGLPQHNETKV